MPPPIRPRPEHSAPTVRADLLQHTQSVCSFVRRKNISRPFPASKTVTSPVFSAGSVFLSFESVR